MYECIYRYLFLYFNEPVAAGSLSLPSITLFSNVSQTFATLTDPIGIPSVQYVSLVNETILQVSLSSKDLNVIKNAIRSGNAIITTAYTYIHTYIRTYA